MKKKNFVPGLIGRNRRVDAKSLAYVRILEEKKTALENCYIQAELQMIQHLEESYKREIKELNNQLYAQYQRNKVLHEEISFLKTKLSSLEDTLEQLVQEKLNA